MKLKWAGSQTKPAEAQASTQDWPSCDTSSLRELSGGQTGGAETLDDQPRAVEFGRGTNRGPVLLLPPAEAGLEKLAGMKSGSAVQKSCRGQMGCHIWHYTHITLKWLARNCCTFVLVWFMITFLQRWGRNIKQRPTCLHTVGLLSQRWPILRDSESLRLKWERHLSVLEY